MAPQRTILITGANRGIGFSTLQALSKAYPSYTYLLACRTLESGHKAVQQLRQLEVEADIDVIELDVDSNKSILAAVETVKEKYGRLDVLVNNAGVARLPGDNLDSLRQSWAETLNTNVTSVAVVCEAFLPPLYASTSQPTIINVSSARGSLARSFEMPPTMVVAYTVSKTALNAFGIELLKKVGEKGVKVYSVSPGHCKTEFNGWRGTKDPLDGARVVVELIEGDKQSGFWEFEEGQLRQVPW